MRKLYLAVFASFFFIFAGRVFGQALNQIQFNTGSQLELVGTSTATLDITTTPTSGGAINISTRSTGSGIFIASSTNNVGIGGITNPQYTLDVSSGSGGFGDVVAGSFSTTVHGPVLTSGDGYIRIGDINYNSFPVTILVGGMSLNVETDSFNFNGGPANFDSAISVGYPVASTDAARKDYVDTNFAPISVANYWKISGNNLYASSTAYSVAIGTTTPAGKLHIVGMGYTDQNTNSDTSTSPTTTTAGGLILDGNYSNGFYRTRLVKIDRGGNLPLYVQQSLGSTALTNIARFGSHSYSTNQFEVFGNAAVSGNFGVGTSSPASLLHLSANTPVARIQDNTHASSSASVDGYILFADSANSQYGYIGDGSSGTNNLDIYGGTTHGVSIFGGGVRALTVNTSGNIGIGTTTPGVKLEINEVTGSAVVPALMIGGSYQAVNAGHSIDFYGANRASTTGRIASVTDTAGNLAELAFYTANSSVVASTEKMRLTKGGNLGIGTTTPAGKAHFWSTSGDEIVYIEADADNNAEDDNPALILRQDGNLVNGLFGIMGSTGQYNDSIANSAFIESKDNGGSAALQFVTGGTTIGGTNGTARMTILANGNIGIATSSPSVELSVYSASGNAASFNQPITVGYPTASTDAATKSYVDAVAGIAQSASWVQSGSYLYPSSTGWSVGIGNSAPAGKLDITHSFSQGTNSALNFGARGVATVSGSGVVSNLYGAYFEANLNTSAAGGSPGTANNYGIYAKASSTNYAHNNTGNTNYYGGYFEATGSADGADTTKNYGIYVNASGADTNYAAIFTGGNVGIGTATPNEALEVNGDIKLPVTAYIGYGSAGATPANGDYLKLQDVGSGTPSFEFVQDGSTKLSVDGTTGNFGIGTNAPGSYKLNVQSGSAQSLFESTSDAQIVLKSSDAWAGILFDDSGATNDYIWYAGANGTFAVGGGGSSVSGKKLHVDGGMTVGANYDSNSISTNGLGVEGSVGVGTTTPATKLHLFDSSSGPILTMSGLTNVYRGVTIKDTAGSEQWFYGPNTSNNFVVRQSGTTDKLTINSTGVGIGAAAQSPFHVALPAWSNHDTDSEHVILGDGSTNGGVRIGYNSSSRIGVINTLDPGSWWGNLVLQSGGGKVGIGTTTPATALQVIGTITATKLNADEVDPPYTINGKKYATYMAGMTGLKEETSGVVKLKNGKAVLDLAGASEGSDLWLFAKTINLAGKIYVSESGKPYETDSEEILNSITVLLTPGFDSRIWYEKKNGKIFINSSEKSGEISYRLTAPRFDAVKKDGNLRTGDDVEGLNLDKLLK